MSDTVSMDLRPRIGVLVSLASLEMGPEVDALVQQMTDRAVAAIDSAGGTPEAVSYTHLTLPTSDLV